MLTRGGRFSVVLLLCVFIVGVGRAGAASSGDRELFWQRFVDIHSLAPGEFARIGFELTNRGDSTFDYTIIEEIPDELQLLDAGDGSYNQMAGFVVWRGSIEAAASITLSYTVQVKEGPSGVIPLYAYLTSTDHHALESTGELMRVDVPMMFTLESPLVHRGDRTIIRLQVENPFSRPLELDFKIAESAALELISQPVPATLQLGAGDTWEWVGEVNAAENGSYPVSIQPTIHGVAAGPANRATLTVYEGERQGLHKEGADLGQLDELGISDRRGHRGVVIIDPLPEQVFTGREQVDIEVAAPVGTTVTLLVNGEEIPKKRVGSLGTDDNSDQMAEKYIAIPLQYGANQLEAKAVTVDGDVTSDSIVVYRSGPPTSISIDPVTELTTGSVRPLIVQVSATDQDGLPPADGTPVTIIVQGGRLLSEDAHQDWVGHQVALYEGSGFLYIEPPKEATALSIVAKVGEVSAEKDFLVAARADSWFVLGHGQVRAEGLRGGAGNYATVNPSMRFFARGPLFRDAVFTAAFDQGGLTEGAEKFDLWVGDTSTRGAFGVSSGPLYVKLEQGLSSLQYGKNLIEFDGGLSPYNKQHDGLHLIWNEVPGLTLKAFHAAEAYDTAEAWFDGDGTGYYRVTDAFIEPNSEEITVVVRDPVFPQSAIREIRINPGRYALDYRTGQIILAEPLPSVDEEGNHLSLRIRYRLVGSRLYRSVGGLQGTIDKGSLMLQATALQTLEPFGRRPLLISFAAQMGFKGAAVEFEAAQTKEAATEANAYLLSVAHPNMLGWDIRFAHQQVEDGFASHGGLVQNGIHTSLRAGRTLGPGVKLSAATTLGRQDVRSPWAVESSLGARWTWGVIHPELMLKASGNVEEALGLTLRAGFDVESERGAIGYVREQTIVGDAPLRDVIEGRYNLAPGLAARFAFDFENAGPHAMEQKMAWGLTKTFTSEAVRTVVKAGYEMVGDSSGADGAVVYGADSTWQVNERNAIELNVERRMPILEAQPVGLGSTFGWTYRHREGGESELRFDHRSDGNRVKQAIQWRALYQVREDIMLQGNALWSVDDPERMRTRLGLGASYRADSTIVLARIAKDRIVEPDATRSTVEWQVKAAHQITPHTLLNIGYGNLQAKANITTAKVNLGATFQPSDRFALLAEISLLQQLVTQSGRLGSMVGLSHRLSPDLWLTVGYKSADYVGIDSTGEQFANTRQGFFIQFDFAFDEWSLRHLLSSTSRR